MDLLAAMDSVPDWMAKEGRYDAEPGISERFCVQMQDEASVVVPMFDAPAATS